MGAVILQMAKCQAPIQSNAILMIEKVAKIQDCNSFCRLLISGVT
jgi:hypothetical protein